MSEQTDSSNPPGPTSSETLFGGANVVIYYDRPGVIDSANVVVRQLKMKEYPQLMRCMDDEIAMAELYTGQSAGWAETLQPASLEGVIIEGERINGDFFARWAQRRMARQERLVPGLVGKMVGEVLQKAQVETAKATSA